MAQLLPIRARVATRRAAVVTIVLIGVNTLAYLGETALSPRDLQTLVYLFGIVPARYSHPLWAEWAGFPLHDYWPFFTSMFLHSGWLHIVGNMWFLWLFGAVVEDRMGPGRFLAFYLLCGLAAGWVHFLTNLDSTVPTVGASGAIAGVLGAYFAHLPRSRITVLVPVLFLPLFVDVPAVFFIGIWILSQAFSEALALMEPGGVANIAFAAHLGGFAAGLALSPLLWKRPAAPRLAAWSPR